ncbi:MAG TPA: carboxypeptidase regulatory-like domain-containing protein [Planctomycetota bacterium]|nr:carboxypeptidase regulatory-like domain-containing protein [Planctomycetota bacterium]
MIPLRLFALIAVLLPGLRQEAATGGVEGVATYTADAQRPWRLGRYYVRKGALSEAVVALTGGDLKAAPATTPATVVVDQKNYQFSPETVAIRIGDRIRFTNSDEAVHNVRAVTLDYGFNESMAPGAEHLQTFKTATGIAHPLKVGCVYHSAMRAWVFVFDHPRFKVTETDGAFRWDGLPPGTYTIDVNHPAGDLRGSATVVVKAGETTKVELRLSPDNRKSDDSGEK